MNPTKGWRLCRSFFVCAGAQLTATTFCGVHPAPGCSGTYSLDQDRATSRQPRQDFRHYCLTGPQWCTVSPQQYVAILDCEHGSRPARPLCPNASSDACRLKHPSERRPLGRQRLHHRSIQKYRRGLVARCQTALRRWRCFDCRRRFRRPQLNSRFTSGCRQHHSIAFHSHQAFAGRQSFAFVEDDRPLRRNGARSACGKEGLPPRDPDKTRRTGHGDSRRWRVSHVEGVQCKRRPRRQTLRLAIGPLRDEQSQRPACKRRSASRGQHFCGLLQPIIKGCALLHYASTCLSMTLHCVR